MIKRAEAKLAEAVSARVENGRIRGEALRLALAYATVPPSAGLAGLRDAAGVVQVARTFEGYLRGPVR